MGNQKKGSAPADKKAEDAKLEAKKVADKKEKVAKAENEAADAAKKLAEMNTELFFIEDGEFFKELGEKISDKKNIDDFSFRDSEIFPGRVKIRQRNCDWAIKTTSKRGDIEGKSGSYLLIDPSGNKLKVSESMFQTLHNKLFGE